MLARHLIHIAGAIVAAFALCAAHAQPLDCASALGQRVCANPNLAALEQQRQSLLGELSTIDAAHPALAQEEAWLSVQQACADDACLAAGYLDHNDVLSQIVEDARAPADAGEPLAELPTFTIPEVRDSAPEPAGRGGGEINPDPPFRFADYLGAILTFGVALLITFWLLSKAARARRGD